MPGLAGFISRAASHDGEADLGRMVASMQHEPFYTSGSLWRPDLGLGVGWVSHPGSQSEARPVWNERNDACLVLSGEHFGDAAGTFKPGDVSREILTRYERNGPRALEFLNGWFSGLLIDLRAGRAILFNDRYGFGRLYIHETPDELLFASEAKALLRVRPQLRQLDLQGLGELLTCGGPLQNRTLFTGVTLLPNASAWSIRFHGDRSLERYFSPAAWERQDPLPADAYLEQLCSTFARRLPAYFGGPQPVALSLTAGLDSRLIMAWARRPPGELPCYTFGGMLRECADVRGAARVARACGQPHQVLALTPEFFAQFPALAARSVYVSDGAMDVSGAVGLFVNRLARCVAPVRLTGNYGSEVLRAHSTFRARIPDPTMFSGELLPHLHGAVETFRLEKNAHPMSFVAFKQVPWYHYGRHAMESSQLVIRSPYLDNELVALAYRAPVDLAQKTHVCHRLIAAGNAELGRLATDRGRLASVRFLPFAVRGFLEEFLPRAEYLFDYGMPHWLAKVDRVMAPLHVERLFLGRQKYAHFRPWYRNELSGFVREVLLDPSTLARPYLEARRVREMVGAHVRGTGNYTTALHRLLTLELIERQLLASP